MCEITRQVQALRRPALLLDAARHRQATLERDGRGPSWRLIIRKAQPRTHAAALEVLLALEVDLEKRRTDRLPGSINAAAAGLTYAYSRHVDILAFILSEFAGHLVGAVPEISVRGGRRAVSA